LEGRRISAKSKIPTIDDINSFIEANLEVEFELLNELQDNCNSSVKLFSKLTSKVDPKDLDDISELIDKLNLANYQVTKLKNNIAMKSFKREMILKNNLTKSEDRITQLEKKTKDSEDNMANIGDIIKSTEKKSAEFEAKAKENENKLSKLEEDVNNSKKLISDLEQEKEEMEKQIKDITAERNELEKKGSMSTEEVILDSKYFKEFSKRDTAIKGAIEKEIKKWKKLKDDLEKSSKKMDTEPEEALEEMDQEIDDLQQELAIKERQISKAKTTKSRDELTKQRQGIKQKLTRARKKYEALKEQLKADYRDPVKAEKIKDEIDDIVEKIDALQHEYDSFAKDLEEDKDTWFTLFETIAQITDKAPKNFKELLKENKDREKVLGSQLEVALKNVEELKEEMDSMDSGYHSDVQQEFERLVKTEEDKYKKLLKKQEDKYKKELEVAAQTMFELKQYIEELEQSNTGGGAAPRPPSGRPSVAARSTTGGGKATGRGSAPEMTPISANSKPGDINSDDQGVGTQGLPLRMPKNGASGAKATAQEKKRKKKQKKKKFEMGKCGSCGEYIPIDSSSCPECGATFEIVDEELVVCGNCGETIPASTKRCPSCNAKFE
jgi:chromosome segregation ATPase